jgi:hypothetical protein
MPKSHSHGRAVGAPAEGILDALKAAEATAAALRAENAQLTELLIAARDEIAALIDRLAETPTD